MDLKAFAAFVRPEVDTEVEDFDSEAFMAEVQEEIASLRESAAERETLAAENEQVKVERDEALESLNVTGAENVELREQIEAFEAKGREASVDAAIETGTIAKSQRDWALSNYPAFEQLLETLGEDQKLGPPQGEATSVETEGDLQPEEGLGVDAIKAYAKENGLSFEKAYIELRKAGH